MAPDRLFGEAGSMNDWVKVVDPWSGKFLSIFVILLMLTVVDVGALAYNALMFKLAVVYKTFSNCCKFVLTYKKNISYLTFQINRNDCESVVINGTWKHQTCFSDELDILYNNIITWWLWQKFRNWTMPLYLADLWPGPIQLNTLCLLNPTNVP